MKALLILVFALLIGYTSGKFCFSCRGLDGTSCSHGYFFPNDPRIGKTECPRFCLKQTGTDEETGKPYTLRGCGGDDCSDRCDNSGLCQYCCQMKELCNGAGAVTFNTVLFVSAAILARLL